MKGPRSLRQRVFIALCVFAAALVALMLVSFHIVFHVSEDTVLRRQLEVELEHLLAHPEHLDAPVVGVSRHLTAFVGLDGVPPADRPRLGSLAPGIHEWGSLASPFADNEVHVAVSPIPGRSETLYLVFDVTSIGITRGVGPVYASAVAIGLLVAVLVGAVAGRALAGLVIEPVTALAQELESGPLETLAHRIEPSRYGEEVGVLAQALADAADRLGAFVARERQFTANASHELRNPITVIHGAAELLETKLGAAQPALLKPLARIQRAVTQMEETIEVFLALAREGDLAIPVEGCSVATVVGEVVEQHRWLLGDKPVAVVQRVPEDQQVAAPPRVLAIVLANLVGNAFRRTLRGTVTITWQEGRVEVRDTGPGLPREISAQATQRHVATDQGHGLGLSIVSALCERFGWELELGSAEGSGTCAALVLGDHPSRAQSSGAGERVGSETPEGSSRET